MNQMDRLNFELKRAKELLKAYESLPSNSGAFGTAIIKRTIEHAELSIRTGNVVEMIKAYNALEKLE